MKNKKNYKYHMTVKWPATCRNRSYETLKERPDLVEQMNVFRQKINTVCDLIMRKDFRVDDRHSLQGVSVWIESGQDVYDFIIRQPEFNWEIVPELSTVNRLTGELGKWEIVYTPTGITIV